MQTLLKVLSTPVMTKNPKQQIIKKSSYNNSEKEVKARELWTEESGKESATPGVFIVTQTKEIVKFFEGI